MKPVFLKWIGPVAAALILITAASGHAQEAQVVFQCEDIGTEARRMLEKLQQEQERFAAREKQLARRENELKILQEEVDKKIKQLKNLRSELDQLLSRKQETEDGKVKQLSKIYQKRDPAGAAASLAAMDKELAVAILAMMRDKYAGEILDNMEQETAVIYSTALGRMGK